MFAVSAVRIDPKDPLSGLELGERDEPTPRAGWTTVTVKAAALNHHDLWTLRGVGITEDKLPMILGCDGAGLDEDGNEVDRPLGGRPPRRQAVHPHRGATTARSRRRSWCRRPTWSPSRPRCPGSRPPACRPPGSPPTACSSAAPACGPVDTVLIQGAGGGVATAAIVLARAAGFRVWATSRSEEKRARAVELGAHAAFESGARLPERVDAVMETVGAATWAHSVKSLRPEGTIVDLRRDHRRHAAGRADPHLLPAAADRRVHHGLAWTSSRRWRGCATRPTCGRSSTRSCRWPRPGPASNGWSRARRSGRSSSRSDRFML